MTYKIYLDNGGVKLFDEETNSHNRPTVRCSCGSITYPYDMIDVRSFHRRLTKGEKFVCMGCYATWEREKHNIDAVDDFLVQEEFRAKFIEVKTGEKNVGAEKVRLEYLEKEKKRILEDELRYASAPDNHPNKVALKSKRVKLENRIKKG